MERYAETRRSDSSCNDTGILNLINSVFEVIFQWLNKQINADDNIEEAEEAC